MRCWECPVMDSLVVEIQWVRNRSTMVLTRSRPICQSQDSPYNAGIANPKPVPPGQVVSITNSATSTDDTCRLENTDEDNISEESAVEKLGSLLPNRLSRRSLKVQLLHSREDSNSTLVAQAAMLTSRRPETVYGWARESTRASACSKSSPTKWGFQ